MHLIFFPQTWAESEVGDVNGRTSLNIRPCKDGRLVLHLAAQRLYTGLERSAFKLHFFDSHARSSDSKGNLFNPQVNLWKL